jgi:hypothetical protein
MAGTAWINAPSPIRCFRCFVPFLNSSRKAICTKRGREADVEESCETPQESFSVFCPGRHHHGEAAKHHEAGNHERAAHHNEIAHAHVIDARGHVQEARKAYAKDHEKE